MNVIVKLIMKYWQIKNEPIKDVNPDIIILTSYGFSRNRVLPDIEKKVLDKATEIFYLKNGNVKKIIFSCADFFWSGSEFFELEKKIQYLTDKGVSKKIIFYSGKANTTITEMQSNNSLVRKEDKVLIICDWIHARRVRLIVKRCIKSKYSKFITVKSNWEKANTTFFQKNDFIWLISNIIHYLMYL